MKGVLTVQGRAILVQLKLILNKLCRSRKVAEKEVVSKVIDMSGSSLIELIFIRK